ncbi:hypothetical protein [Microbacterium rhizomatis]|nr:hypothetical protein [Microbacterium rhizomatis]
MVLNLLAGDVDDERLARLAERVATHSHKGGGKLFRALAERGWIVEEDGTWTLTDEGRAQRDVFKTRVDAIRERVTAAVSPEDYATTVASLEAVAREFGWDGAERMPRGFGRRGFGHGFGPGRGFGPGFGPGRGFGYGHPDFGRGRPGFGPDDAERHGHHGCGPDAHGTSEHRHHGRHGHPGAREGRKTERAYERGFEAGFAAASRVSSKS